MASSKQIVTKTLRNVILDLKEGLVNGEVSSYAWLPTHNMWAYILKKEKQLLEALKDVLTKNIMDLGDTTLNKVKAFGQIVCMTNIKYQKTSLKSP